MYIQETLASRKSRIIYNVIICILLVTGLSIINYDVSYASSDTTTMDVKVDIGIEGLIKDNIAVPIKITIKNDGDAFKGRVRVLKQEWYNSDTNYIAYSKNIELEANSETVHELTGTFYNNTKIYVEIVDVKGKIVLHKIVKELSVNKFSGLIGVYTEKDLSQYDENVLIKNMEYEIKKLSLDDFINPAILSNYNIIVLSSFNPDLLTSKHIKVLKFWLDSGGELIIGNTSQNKAPFNIYNQLFSKRNYTYEDYNGIKKFSGIDFYEINYNNIKYFRNISGNITVLPITFDMDIENLASNILSNNFYETPNPVYGYSNFTEYIPYSELPSKTLILFLIISFPLIVGPISYLVLKRYDKREYLWVSIPVITLVYCVVLYGMGIGSTLKEPIQNSLGFINMDENGEAQIVSKSTISAFSLEDYELEFGNDVFILKEDTIYNYKNMSKSSQRIIKEYDFTDNYTIKYFDKMKLEPITTSSVEWKQLGNGVKLEFSLKDNRVFGSIKNNMDIDLKDVIITYNESLTMIDDIKAHSEVNNITFDIAHFDGSDLDIYNRINDIYEADEDDSKDLLNNDVKFSILTTTLQGNLSKSNNVNLIAWNTDSIVSDIKLDGKSIKRIDRNMIVMDAPIKHVNGGRINDKNKFIKPIIVELENVIISNHDFRGDGQIVLKYNYPPNIDGVTIKLDFKKSKLSKEFVKILLYNYKTKQWEKYDEDVLIKTGNNNDKYYDQVSGILVKFDLSRKYQYCAFPELSIEGVVNNAEN